MADVVGDAGIVADRVRAWDRFCIAGLGATRGAVLAMVGVIRSRQSGISRDVPNFGLMHRSKLLARVAN